VSAVTRVVVLADTHLRADRDRRLPDIVWRAIDDADLVLHAGDVVDRSLFDELDAHHVAYRAVLGNNDRTLTLPEQLTFDVEGVTIAMVHESGPTKGRAARMRKRFPDAHVVVFGHSHTPCDEWHDGQLLFNPGSATERRREPHHSYGVLELADGHVREHAIVTF
jgi:putative phosphoesterase